MKTRFGALLCRINNQTCRHTYILSRVLAVLGPRRLESAELGPRLGPEGVELCRLEQDVALVHPSRHQDALMGWKNEMNWLIQFIYFLCFKPCPR